MNLPDELPVSVYASPRYYAIGYQWNTEEECHFLETCLGETRTPAKTHVLDIGCGAGRHMLELARRGYQVTGFDLRPEMVAYVQEESRKAKQSVTVTVGDLRDVPVTGTYHLAICLMDTFRFLLTNDEIIAHLRKVAERLVPDGLYVTDFWVPMQWDKIANEIYQWEQTRDETTVRVFYVQHPESVDPAHQTFEDELVFSVDDHGSPREIRGARTRTRLILPQEFHALVAASGMFDVVGTFAGFDLEKPLASTSDTWRMVSVLKKRG